MCLLIVLSGVVPTLPLVVAANRDERVDRPATAMTVLGAGGPRILGGRDELAGGTWLAVNAQGVVAGLTNRPSAAGRDPTLRSRGELPLALAHQASAERAAEVALSWRPAEYNPAWLMVADRRAAFYIDLSGDKTEVRQLPSGVHILENRAITDQSPKVDRVRRLLEAAQPFEAEGLRQRLGEVLADHVTPPPADGPTENQRPAATEAACVHLEVYGTRSSEIVTVPSSSSELPSIWYTDGPPCVSEYADAAELWSPA
ncbi:MAG TPA: NRDE family protein [Acidimicrobiales bacterium]|nr:NRDE family protein [Acidimicrobiales bacterium]